MKTDFRVSDHGTIILLFPRSDAAREWIAENVQADHMTWGNIDWNGVVIERRYFPDICNGISNDNLTIGRME